MEKNKRNYSDYSYFDSAEQIKRLKRDTKEEIIVYPNLYNSKYKLSDIKKVFFIEIYFPSFVCIEI